MKLKNPNDEDYIDAVSKPMKPLNKNQMLAQLRDKNIIPPPKKKADLRKPVVEYPKVITA